MLNQSLRVLDKAEYLAFDSTLNSAIVSYRIGSHIILVLPLDAKQNAVCRLSVCSSVCLSVCLSVHLQRWWIVIAYTEIVGK